MSEILTETEWKKKFWGKLNPKCLKCKRKCKQSAKVKIIRCPLFEPKEIKNEAL